MQKIDLSVNSERVVPSKVDFYSLIEPRLIRPSKTLVEDMRRTKIGYDGEMDAVNIFKQNGRNHWSYMTNVWLEDNGRYEIDLLVITSAAIYTFEIKNYDGIFTYDNGDCTLGDLDLEENCISQASRSFKKFKKLCSTVNIKCPIYGGLIFIGEYCQVFIKSPVNTIQISSRSQLRHLIRTIKIEEDKNDRSTIHIDKLVHALSRVVIPEPFVPASLSENKVPIKNGIYCANCKSFDVHFSRFYTECDCGLSESCEESVVRTICEYGVLNYTQDLRRGKINDFINNQFSYPYVAKQLEHYFERVNTSKLILYKNKREPLDQLSEQFHFKRQKKFASTF